MDVLAKKSKSYSYPMFSLTSKSSDISYETFHAHGFPQAINLKTEKLGKILIGLIFILNCDRYSIETNFKQIMVIITVGPLGTAPSQQVNNWKIKPRLPLTFSMSGLADSSLHSSRLICTAPQGGIWCCLLAELAPMDFVIWVPFLLLMIACLFGYLCLRSSEETMILLLFDVYWLSLQTNMIRILYFAYCTWNTFLLSSIMCRKWLLWNSIGRFIRHRWQCKPFGGPHTYDNVHVLCRDESVAYICFEIKWAWIIFFYSYYLCWLDVQVVGGALMGSQL